MNDPMSLDAFGIRHSLTIKALRSKSSWNDLTVSFETFCDALLDSLSKDIIKIQLESTISPFLMMAKIVIMCKVDLLFPLNIWRIYVIHTLENFGLATRVMSHNFLPLLPLAKRSRNVWAYNPGKATITHWINKNVNKTANMDREYQTSKIRIEPHPYISQDIHRVSKT